MFGSWFFCLICPFSFSSYYYYSFVCMLNISPIWSDWLMQWYCRLQKHVKHFLNLMFINYTVLFGVDKVFFFPSYAVAVFSYLWWMEVLGICFLKLRYFLYFYCFKNLFVSVCLDFGEILSKEGSVVVMLVGFISSDGFLRLKFTNPIGALWFFFQGHEKLEFCWL